MLVRDPNESPTKRQALFKSIISQEHNEEIIHVENIEDKKKLPKESSFHDEFDDLYIIDNFIINYNLNTVEKDIQSFA